MTRQERINHIWYYFKWHIVAVAICIIAIISLSINIIQSSKNDVLGGAILNVSISEEGTTYLNDNYLQFCGYKKSKNQVFIFNSGIKNLSADELQLNPDFTMAFTTMLGAKKLDFLIMDKPVMDYYIAQNYYMDLRQIFTTDELQALSENLIYTDITIDGIIQPIPIAICIDELPFTVNCIQSSQSVYLLFSRNAPNKNQLKSFYDYLCSWNAA